MRATENHGRIWMVFRASSKSHICNSPWPSSFLRVASNRVEPQRSIGTLQRTKTNTESKRHAIDSQRVSAERRTVELAHKALRQDKSHFANCGGLEGIDRIGCYGRKDRGLQGLLLHDIHRTIEQPIDEVLDRDIIPHTNPRIRIDLDHDVGIAFRPRIPASARAEQRGMRHATRAQRRFVLPQPSDDVLALHAPSIARNEPPCSHARCCPNPSNRAQRRRPGQSGAAAFDHLGTPAKEIRCGIFEFNPRPFGARATMPRSAACC
jgi:hypothetical protein